MSYYVVAVNTREDYVTLRSWIKDSMPKKEWASAITGDPVTYDWRGFRGDGPRRLLVSISRPNVGRRFELACSLFGCDVRKVVDADELVNARAVINDTWTV